MKKIITRVGKGLAVAGAAVGAQAAINAFLAGKGGPLQPVLGGTHSTYKWRLGRIHYTVAGDGPPLLLVHGIGAGASSYEWRRNFEALSAHYQVYALDLLGFGLSARPAMQHSGRYYVQLLDDFIRYVIKRDANVMASSHSTAYAIRLAYTRPERIRSLILVCPVGMGQRPEGPTPLERMGTALDLPLVGDSAYHILTSRANIARTLREEIYYDPGQVTEAMIDQYYTSAHGPGARQAIAAFLKGDLYLDISAEFQALKQPVLMVWGAESTYTPVTRARAFQEANGNAILHLFADTRQVPQDEKADDFNRLALSWLKPLTNDQVLRVLG
ncbi:MAG: alpha/beta fold hydrolase [Armatimonadota bacterium]|nr:alpha/beta fold hydrolase [Armatimonadota bacterium]